MEEKERPIPEEVVGLIRTKQEQSQQRRTDELSAKTVIECLVGVLDYRSRTYSTRVKRCQHLGAANKVTD